jgi:hypothetical protein
MKTGSSSPTLGMDIRPYFPDTAIVNPPSCPPHETLVLRAGFDHDARLSWPAQGFVAPQRFVGSGVRQAGQSLIEL